MVKIASGGATHPFTMSVLTTQRGVTVFMRGHHKQWQKVRYSSTLDGCINGSASSNRSPPPLSALPTSSLLRSLLISTISSKPYLLRPSLAVLSVLCKPNRPYLLDVDRNPLLRAFFKRIFYKQFCAGESRAEARNTVQDFKDLGFRGLILTYAKETVFDHHTKTEQGLGVKSLGNGKNNVSNAESCSAIEAWRVGTLQTVDLLDDGDYLAVKLTGAGPRVTQAFSAGQIPPQQMMDALFEIGEKCQSRNVRILVDAESQQFQSGILLATLELMRKFNRDGFALIYNTYQAYLKSTPTTVAKHLAVADREGFTLGLKLVRGAYIASDERSLIHDTKQNTDDAYNNVAQSILRNEFGEFGANGGKQFPSVDLFLASHNKASMLAAHQLHRQRLTANLPTTPVAFAQLQGMSDDVSFALLQLRDQDNKAPEVYKCSTWGTMSECMAYLLRRAIENRDAVSRTFDEYTALKAELGRRLKSVFSLSR